MTEETWWTESIFTVDGFLTPEECRRYIQIAEEFGFEPATLTSPAGDVRVEALRNNDRVLMENAELAEELWERTAEVVPHEWEGREPVGLNPLFRFYRYTPGQHFEWHQDHPYERDNGEQSLLTLIVYLNEGFSGGETAFEDSCSDDAFEDFEIVPAAGLALFFLHPTMHRGNEVLKGTKYVMRTDVMYSPPEDEAAVDDWEEEEDTDWRDEEVKEWDDDRDWEDREAHADANDDWDEEAEEDEGEDDWDDQDFDWDEDDEDDDYEEGDEDEDDHNW